MLAAANRNSIDASVVCALLLVVGGHATTGSSTANDDFKNFDAGFHVVEGKCLTSNAIEYPMHFCDPSVADIEEKADPQVIRGRAHLKETLFFQAYPDADCHGQFNYTTVVGCKESIMRPGTFEQFECGPPQVIEGDSDARVHRKIRKRHGCTDSQCIHDCTYAKIYGHSDFVWSGQCLHDGESNSWSWNCDHTTHNSHGPGKGRFEVGIPSSQHVYDMSKVEL